MPLRTLIIDDEPIALEKLRAYVNKTPSLLLVGEADNALDASAMMADLRPDLIITDINMPDLDGLSFIESLPEPPLVIFTTAYAEYAVRSYRVPTVDYLLKPYNFADFQRGVNKALERAGRRLPADGRLTGNNSVTGIPDTAEDASPEIRKNTYPEKIKSESRVIFVKVDYRYIRVELSDIRYVKGYGEYLQIFLDSNPTPLTTLGSFGGIMQLLDENFLQVHRSYVVNMNHVRRVEKMRLVMDEETSIPVSDSFREDFLSFLESRSFGSKR